MAAPNFQMVPSGPAPDGWRVATCAEAQASLGAVKGLFGSGLEWHICKLKDGKISGPGYHFKIEPGHTTKKEVGHMIIIEKGGQRGRGAHHIPAGPPLQFMITSKGAAHPGWRIASYQQVCSNLDQVKAILTPHQWYICALQDGSISGPGHNYDLKHGGSTASLGHMLLVKTPELEFNISPMGAAPFGWRMASYHEVADNLGKVKSLLAPHQWHICALADGSIAGPGHQYSLKQGLPDQPLGHMIITKPK